MANTNAKTSTLSMIQSNLSVMTKSEAVVCDFILQDSEKIIHYSVAELAEKSGTSGATVIRTCRKMGFSSFMAFKVALAQDLAAPSEYKIEEIIPDSSAAETMRYVFQNTLHALSSAYQQIEPNLLERTADALLAAGRILIYGSGSALSLAHHLTHKLLRVGLDAVCYADTFYQLYSTASLKKGDVLFLISRMTDELPFAHMIEQAKKCGATVILLMDGPAAACPLKGDIILSSSTDPNTIGLTQYTYQTVQSMMIDMIYVLMALKKGNTTEDFYSMEAIAALYAP